MSASEKLERLAQSRAIEWPACSDEEWRLAEDAERLRKNAIAVALPEIVAVVRTAEDVGRNRDLFMPIGEPRHLDALVDALAILDAKLGEP